MQISIIGAGRIGLYLGASFGEAGFLVVFTDKNLIKLEQLSKQKISFYEPDLEKTLINNWSQFQWTQNQQTIYSSDVIFLSLSTGVTKNGEPDITEILNLCQQIAKHAQNTAQEKILVIKSTLPVGTNNKLHALAQKHSYYLHIVTCPEFLRQGQAMSDIKNGDRLVIGSRDKNIAKKIEKIYKSFYKGRIIHSSVETAELSKLASNSFLSLKISFINEIAHLSEKFDIDRQDLKLILGSDKRISLDFLNSGLGFGGYCLPKDLQMTINQGQCMGLDMNLLKAAQHINKKQVSHFIQKIKMYFGDLQGKSFAFWGLTFKKETDDTRNSPALYLARDLLEAGAKLKIYDPLLKPQEVLQAISNEFTNSMPHSTNQQSAQETLNVTSEQQIKESNQQTQESKNYIRESKPQTHKSKQLQILKQVQACNDILNTLTNQDGLIVASNSDEFLSVSLKNIKSNLKIPFIVDGRNLFSAQDLKQAGFDFYQAGASHFS